jgi:UDP-2,3-diacylglucosamine pyrophosphatase LpxH
MGSKAAFIVSDLHLGSEHFYHRCFLSWLDDLSADAQLILNGDTIDDPRQPLCSEHQAVLQRLVRESYQRSLIWVYGNHDAGLVLEDPGRIRFVEHWEIERRLLVVHGDDFDQIMPRHGLFKKGFKLLHGLYTALGFRKVHVAEYAKKWAFLYRVLNEHVAHNALDAARSQGFQAVSCGHTHAVMDLEREGARYLNTGSWTERPLYYIAVDTDKIDLCLYEGEKN